MRDHRRLGILCNTLSYIGVYARVVILETLYVYNVILYMCIAALLRLIRILFETRICEMRRGRKRWFCSALRPGSSSRCSRETHAWWTQLLRLKNLFSRARPTQWIAVTYLSRAEAKQKKKKRRINFFHNWILSLLEKYRFPGIIIIATGIEVYPSFLFFIYLFSPRSTVALPRV